MKLTAWGKYIYAQTQSACFIFLFKKIMLDKLHAYRNLLWWSIVKKVGPPVCEPEHWSDYSTGNLMVLSHIAHARNLGPFCYLTPIPNPLKPITWQPITMTQSINISKYGTYAMMTHIPCPFNSDNEGGTILMFICIFKAGLCHTRWSHFLLFRKMAEWVWQNGRMGLAIRLLP